VACLFSKTGTASGTCDFVPVDTDPDGECPGSNCCAGDGTCDTSGGCP
jgi:hypothetical protein